MTIERKRLRRKIDNLYDGMPIDAVVERIDTSRDFAAKNDYVNLQLDIDRDGYDGSVYLHITGLRWETDAELERRIANEVANKAARDWNERELYEELKRKFEGK